MDLFCPHCTRRVSIPDDKAGQVMSCPLCAKQFMAPSLAPAPVAPKPPPPSPPPMPSAPVETYGMGPAPVMPTTITQPPTSMPSAPEPAPTAPPSPPAPPGEYSRSSTCTLTGAWLVFVPTACVLLIFLLSFFTWHSPIPQDAKADEPAKTGAPALGLWGLSFVPQKSDEVKQAHFLAYTILMLFPTGGLVFVALLFAKIPLPPQLAPVLPWKNLPVALLLLLTFLLLCLDFADAHFSQRINPIAIPLELAIRLHFLAMMASFVMFWLDWRKKYNLPPPKCETRW
jgi:hypothetical protein